MIAARDLIAGDPQTVRETTARMSSAGWMELLHHVPPPFHPMLDYTLHASGAAANLAADVVSALKTARQAAIVSDLQRRSVLRQLIATLSANRIETVVLKGAALANSLYPHSHLRPMSDLDFWLPHRELDRAVELLLQSGFQLVGGALPDGRLTPALDQRRLVAKPSGVLVELHGAIHSLECLSQDRVARLHAASVPLSAHGIQTRRLSAGDQLVHTCLHLARVDRFANSQLSLFDVHLIVKGWRSHIDWAWLASDARDQQMATYLTLALTVAADVWGTNIPSEYLDAVGPIPNLPEMKALALEQVRERATLPSALEGAFRNGEKTSRFAALARRAVRSPSFLTDITVKLPAYARAWLRGDLSGRELRRRADLAGRRGRIGRLVGEAEARQPWPRKLPVFGIPISATTYNQLADAILTAVRERQPARITAVAVHGLMTAVNDAGHRAALDTFDALAPDGQPVRVALNVLHHAALPDRVRAVDLTLLVCERAARERMKIYLYGSRPDVVDALRGTLLKRFAGLQIVGCEPGAYRTLSAAEDAALVDRINNSGADLLLVGLGCPYQEAFVHHHRDRIRAVQMCVGSVFDIVSGNKRNAPQWIQRAGLEWLFRLAQEPGRLWKRYLTTNAQFIAYFVAAVVRQKLLATRQEQHDA